MLDNYSFGEVVVAQKPAITQALACILIFTIAVVVGQRTQYFTNRANKYVSVSQKSDTQGIIKRVYIFFFVYLTFSPLLIQTIGGWSILTLKVRGERDRLGQLDALPAMANAILYVAPVVLLSILLLAPNTRSAFSKMVIVLLFTWILFLANPRSNPRQLILSILLPILLINLHRFARKLFPLITFAMLSFATVAGTVWNRYTGEISSFQFRPLSRLGDFDAFSQLVLGLELWNKGSFEPFRQLKGVIFFFVPRSAWVNKPLDTGVEIAKQSGFSFQNLSAPLQLELVANFGYALLITGGLLCGLLLNKCELFNGFSLRGQLIYFFLCGSLFIVLRGSLLQATGRVVFGILLIFVLTSFQRGRNKSSK